MINGLSGMGNPKETRTGFRQVARLTYGVTVHQGMGDRDRAGPAGKGWPLNGKD